MEKDIYCICLAHKLLSNVLQAKTVEGSTDRSKWRPVPFSDSDIIRIDTAGWFQVEVSEVDPDGFPLFNLDCLLGVKIVGVRPSRIKVWRGQNSICFQLIFCGFGDTLKKMSRCNFKLTYSTIPDSILSWPNYDRCEKAHEEFL